MLEGYACDHTASDKQGVTLPTRSGLRRLARRRGGKTERTPTRFRHDRSENAERTGTLESDNHRFAEAQHQPVTKRASLGVSRWVIRSARFVNT